MARPEMITVKGTSFIVPDLQSKSLSEMLKFTKNSNVTDDIVTEAWEKANPEKVAKAKAKAAEKAKKASPDSTED